MKKGTVRRRIFVSNTAMVLATLFLFLMMNLLVVKIYSETIEKAFLDSAEQIVNGQELEELLKQRILYQNKFLLLIAADGITCVLILFGVSRFFTRNLTLHIMEPLDDLIEGAKRVQNNDLQQEIVYTGDEEFEQVCDVFNEMQHHLCEEQEKNHKYEKARTDMIAGISHDLRTPLTAIRGTIKGLLDGVASSPEMREKFLQTAYRRTGEMEVLLKQLFDFSTLETGNLPISLQNVELVSFLKNYTAAKTELADPEAEHFVLKTEKGSMTSSIDPEQLWRIFDNLLENSRKYAERTPLEIEIRAEQKGQTVEIRFSDHGVGVPEEKLPYVFDEFYRADESRNRREGNGLGLYIVKYLVQAMNGSVHASKENGFTVSMTFPLLDETKAPQEDADAEQQ